MSHGTLAEWCAEIGDEAKRRADELRDENPSTAEAWHAIEQIATAGRYLRSASIWLTRWDTEDPDHAFERVEDR